MVVCMIKDGFCARGLKLPRQLVVLKFAQTTRHLAYPRLPGVIFAISLFGKLVFLNSWASHLHQCPNAGISAAGKSLNLTRVH